MTLKIVEETILELNIVQMATFVDFLHHQDLISVEIKSEFRICGVSQTMYPGYGLLQTPRICL
jgi:hypothetical protein